MSAIILLAFLIGYYFGVLAMLFFIVVSAVVLAKEQGVKVKPDNSGALYSAGPAGWQPDDLIPSSKLNAIPTRRWTGSGWEDVKK